MISLNSMFCSRATAAITSKQIIPAHSKSMDFASSFLQKIGLRKTALPEIKPLATLSQPQHLMNLPNIHSARINFREVSPLQLSGFGYSGANSRIQQNSAMRAQAHTYISPVRDLIQSRTPQGFEQARAQHFATQHQPAQKNYTSEYSRPHQADFQIFPDDTRFGFDTKVPSNHFEIFRDDTHIQNHKSVQQDSFSMYVDDTGLHAPSPKSDKLLMGFSAIPGGEPEPYTFNGGLSQESINAIRAQLTGPKTQPQSTSSCLNTARNMSHDTIANELKAFTQKKGGDLEENYDFGHNRFNQSEDFKGTLQPHEAASMTVYSLNSFKKMNTLLRSNTAFNQMPSAERKGWTKMIAVLDTALSKCQKNPDLVHTGLVTRRGTIPEHILKNLKVGSTYSDSGFMSTSAGTGGNTSFYGNATFKINSKSGVLLKGQSDNPDENEVLFRPDTQFSVKSILQKPGGSVLIMLDEK